MQRIKQFTFRINNDERRAIASLATQLKRSQSDAVRFVVIEAARQLAQADSPLVTKDLRQEPGGTYVTD